MSPQANNWWRGGLKEKRGTVWTEQRDEEKTGLGLAPAVTMGISPSLGKQECGPAICCGMKPSSCSLIKNMLAKIACLRSADFLPGLTMATTVPVPASTGAARKQEAANLRGGYGPASAALCNPGRSWAVSGFSCNRCLAFDFDCVISCLGNSFKSTEIREIFIKGLLCARHCARYLPINHWYIYF